MQKSKTFTHCLLVDSSTDICWTRPFVISGVPGLFLILLANILDPDQTTHYVASDLGLHCWINNVASDQGLQCLLIPFKWFPGKNGLMVLVMCTTILTKSDEHLKNGQPAHVHRQSDQ